MNRDRSLGQCFQMYFFFFLVSAQVHKAEQHRESVPAGLVLHFANKHIYSLCARQLTSAGSAKLPQQKLIFCTCH